MERFLIEWPDPTLKHHSPKNYIASFLAGWGLKVGRRHSIAMIPTALCAPLAACVSCRYLHSGPPVLSAEGPQGPELLLGLLSYQPRHAGSFT
jgi:hypothetical protein